MLLFGFLYFYTLVFQCSALGLAVPPSHGGRDAVFTLMCSQSSFLVPKETSPPP